jgi:hypothetical protein
MNTTYGKLQSSPTGTGLGLAFNFATFTSARHSRLFFLVRGYVTDNNKIAKTLSFKVVVALQPSQSRYPPHPTTASSLLLERFLVQLTAHKYSEFGALPDIGERNFIEQVERIDTL